MRGVINSWVAGAMAVSLGLVARGEEPYRVIYPKQDRQVGEALARPVQEPAFSGLLRDILVEVAEAHHVSVIIDEQALSDAGTADEVVTVPVEGMTLGEALDKLLGNFDLTYVVEDGVLKVTAEEVAAGQSLLRAYDVTPLLGPDTTMEDVVGAAARLVRAPEAHKSGPFDVSDLMISVGSRAMSPPRSHPVAEVVPFKTMLVVTGNPEEHRRIERTLRMLAQIAED